MTDFNTIDPRVFPPSARRGRECGQLKLAGIRASDLVAEYGSPLYVVDEESVRNAARAMKTAFETEFARVGTTATVYYAGKAFLCVEVAAWVAGEGLNLDVASGGELAVALAAGIAPSRIGFHGNNKSHQEISRAVGLGVGTIVLDSEQEIDRVSAAAAAAGRVQRVRLRMNSGVHAGAHAFLATAHEDQKFGLPLTRAVELGARVAADPHLDFVGLHGHIGSQIFAPEAFREAARRLLGVYGELANVIGSAVPELNLGGGFGIAYTEAEADEVPDIGLLAAQIADIVAQVSADLAVPLPKVSFEPGRAIVGQAGVTLYTVGTTKAVAIAGSDSELADPRDAAYAERIYVSIDGGMSDNARTALYGADFHARIANRESAADPALVRVVGKHCESGDIVVNREILPGDIQPGDVIAVAATGAYCWSLSSNYNYVPRPPVVAVRAGESRMIIRGETEDELLAKSVY